MAITCKRLIGLDIHPFIVCPFKVGESGSGKSTLIRLLFRLIEPQEGQILFNGVEIGQYSLGQFRQAIGVVPQDCVLFNDTIGQNIRYGRREAGWQEVEKAAKAAQIHAFIASHPDGLFVLLMMLLAIKDI
jgi:ATP-binding cassette subfamily B protein